MFVRYDLDRLWHLVVLSASNIFTLDVDCIAKENGVAEDDAMMNCGVLTSCIEDCKDV